MGLLPFPIPLWFDQDGHELEDGYIYIGEAGLNARENPIQVYWDADLTQTAAQPVRTSGGYPTYQGAPSGLFVAEAECSVTVLDKFQRTVLLNETTVTGGGGISAGGVFALGSRALGMATYVPASVNSLTTLGYYNIGDGGGAAFARHSGALTDTASFQSADGAWWLYVPEGGSINAYQFGAIDDGDLTAGTGTDNRVFIQSAITFIRAYLDGGAVVRFPGNNTGQYKFVATQRLTSPGDNGNSDPTGNILVFEGQTPSITFDGMGKAATLFARGYGDVNIATTWQTVAGYLWRGNFFLFRGTTAGTPIGEFTLKDIIVDGCAARTDYNLSTTTYAGSYYPANTALNTPNGPTLAGQNIVAGDGWDTTHRCVQSQDQYTTNFTFQNAELRNFRGEIIGIFGSGNGGCYIDGLCKIGSTNGDCVSVSCAPFVVMPGAVLHEAAACGIENGQFTGQTLIDGITVQDCRQEGITILQVGSGAATSTQIINNVMIDCPTAIVTYALCNLTIDNNTFYDCGIKYSTGVKRCITVQGTRGSLHVALKNISICDNNFICDQRDLDIGLLFWEDPSYLGDSRNVEISRNNINRSAYAEANGFEWERPFDFSVCDTGYPYLIFKDNIAMGCTLNSQELASVTDFTVPTTAATVVATYGPPRYNAAYEISVFAEGLINSTVSLQVDYSDRSNVFTVVYPPTVSALTGLNATAITAGQNIAFMPITIRPRISVSSPPINVRVTSDTNNSIMVTASIRKVD